MQVSEWINVLILLATILPFLYTLHVQNRTRSQRIVDQLGELTTLTRKHDKRSKKLSKAFDQHLAKFHKEGIAE